MSAKILIIEDDESIAGAVKIALEFEGFEAEVITHPKEVMAGIRIYKPDLILLDLLLSGVDGRDIAHAVKKNKQTKHIPIILMSAHATAEKIAKEVGIDDFLAKPFDISTLTEKVSAFVRRY